MHAYTLKYDDDQCGCELVRTSDGEVIAVDFGEPEDKTFYRDFSPVVEELNRLAALVDGREA